MSHDTPSQNANYVRNTEEEYWLTTLYQTILEPIGCFLDGFRMAMIKQHARAP